MKRMERMKGLGLLVVLAVVLLLLACGSSDKKSAPPATDGDEATDVDGDGEVEAETEAEVTLDGDVEAESEAVHERCTAASNTLCFYVNDPKGKITGDYVYVPNEILESGCSLDGQTWQLDMYKDGASQVNFVMTVTAYDGAKAYADEASGLLLKWKPTDSSGNTVSWNSHLPSFPCSVTLSDANTGSFDCTLLNMDDETYSISVSGAFACTPKTKKR